MHDTFEHMSRAQAFAVLTRGSLGFLARPELPRLGRVDVMTMHDCPRHGVEVVMVCEDAANSALADAQGSPSVAVQMPMDFAERLDRGGERERAHVERVMRAEWN